MLYDIAFLIFSIFYLPTLLFKGKLHGNFLERFGIYDRDKQNALASGRDTVWIQAVSVGEVSLCRKLIPLIREKFPGRKIVLSTITKTGNALAKKLFSKDAVIIYFPLDLSFIVKKALSLIKPKLYIMVETEIWPNMLREISRLSIASLIVNGRISDKSFGRYTMARPFLKGILKKVSAFCVQSKLDAGRMISLGAPANKVMVTGNMKFDITAPPDAGSAQKMKEGMNLQYDEELFVAGSTHKGEEEIVVAAYRELVKNFPRPRLVIAPRHIERAGEVEDIVNRSGFKAVRISRMNSDSPAPDAQSVFILDTIGQLNDFYSIATIVFVGGSLVRHGGQNPIEPAVLGKPILFGPNMFNFKDVADIFLTNAAALQVSGKADLIEKARLLLNDAEKRLSLGYNAKNAVFKNRGATEKNLEIIERALSCKP